MLKRTEFQGRRSKGRRSKGRQCLSLNFVNFSDAKNTKYATFDLSQTCKYQSFSKPSIPKLGQDLD